MDKYARSRSGFTLIEVLVTLAIVAFLVAILLPALSAGRSAARDLECRTRVRSVCQSFVLFADESGIGSRGDSDQLGDNRFRLEDFQESIYGISEFWEGSPTGRVPLSGKATQLMCPASSGRLDRRPRTPCSGGAVDPQKNVSVGLNRRLEVRTRYVNDRPVPARAYLTPQILHLPDVPLVLDVDGERAARAGTPPYYTAPPITNDKSEDIYENGAFWFPSSRHRGRLNVGFVGGHVLSSARPTNEPWWRWDYQPEI